MGTAKHHIEVEAPAQACYDWWRGLTRLPEILSDVKTVAAVDGNAERTRWMVTGLAGASIEWEARIVEDAPPRRIAWTTVDDTDPDVRHAGEVRFDDLGDARTRLEVSLEYQPPAGRAGEAGAALLVNPQSKVEKAMTEFKRIIETR